MQFTPYGIKGKLFFCCTRVLIVPLKLTFQKNRKAIPCYWESQPGGCLKPHCPFLHQSTKHPSLSEGEGEPSDLKTQELKKGK